MSFRWLYFALAASVLWLALADLFVEQPGRTVLTAFALGTLIFAFYLARRSEQRYNQAREQMLTLREEQEQTLVQFKRLERQQQFLIQGLPIPLIICDREAILRSANQTALDWFGFRALTGKSILALTFCYDLYVLFLTAVQRRSQVVSEVSFSFPVERHTVASIWFLGETDEGERYAIALLDKSELVRLEQVRRDFVANVSHEFRTPLASIRSLAETILQDNEMPPNTRERFLNLIIQETDRLTRIADDLLVLSRAESLPPQREVVELGVLAQRAVEQVRTEAQSRGVSLTTEIQSPLTVLANADQMIQVILNLLTNAIRYNKPEGSIRVRTYVREPNHAVIEVSDTGIGIPSEDLPRIFERFYRVDKTRSRETGGTGLGLAIVKHIVESHGGQVEVESEYRVGSTFRIVLPLYPTQANASEASSPTHQETI
ncbi:MAG: ATP-binding protein [Fimbriimonadales bacterium]